MGLPEKKTTISDRKNLLDYSVLEEISVNLKTQH